MWTAFYIWLGFLTLSSILCFIASFAPDPLGELGDKHKIGWFRFNSVILYFTIGFLAINYQAYENKPIVYQELMTNRINDKTLFVDEFGNTREFDGDVKQVYLKKKDIPGFFLNKKQYVGSKD